MRKGYMLASPALAFAAFVGVQAAEGGGTLYVREAMQGQINATTVDLWDIGNNAMSDTGGIDPALMDDEKWARLIASAETLEAESRAMAEAETIRAAVEEEAEDVEPGTFSMKDVQSYIDADPDQFRTLAEALGVHAGEIVKAAKARDAETAGLLVGELDTVCEACHAKYWYPQG